MLFNLAYAVLGSVSAVRTAHFTSGTPTARSGFGEKICSDKPPPQGNFDGLKIFTLPEILTLSLSVAE